MDKFDEFMNAINIQQLAPLDRNLTCYPNHPLNRTPLPGHSRFLYLRDALQEVTTHKERLESFLKYHPMMQGLLYEYSDDIAQAAKEFNSYCTIVNNSRKVVSFKLE